MPSTEIFQTIMDKAYKKWQAHENWRYEDFIRNLKGMELQAVVLGNFNYQVENGGIRQWIGNGYSIGKEKLMDTLEKLPGINGSKLYDKLYEMRYHILEDDYQMEEYDWEYLDESGFDNWYYNMNNDLMKDAENYFANVLLEKAGI